MTVQRLRLEKGWSQERLAQLSGLSLRTIQRIERGQKAGLESLNCLAATLETDVAGLVQEHAMVEKQSPERSGGDDQERREAIEYVQNLKGFHLNWLTFVIIVPCLYGLNIYTSPEYLWIFWVIGGWGFGIALHALAMFGLYGMFNSKWEQRQIEKRLGRHP